MPSPSKVCIAAKILPATKREVERRAERISMRPCELAANIIEAWKQNLFFCPVCRIPHEFNCKHLPGKGAL